MTPPTEPVQPGDGRRTSAEATEATGAVEGGNDDTSKRIVLRFASAMLRPAWISTSIGGALAVSLAGVLLGGKAALGAALGTLVVLVSGWCTVELMRRTAGSGPMTVFGAGVGGYCAKFVLLLILLIAVRDTSLFDVGAFGLSILAGAVIWTTAELIGFLRLRVATVTPDPRNS